MLNLGKYQEAIENCKILLKNTGFSSILGNIAQFHSKLGDCKVAIKIVHKLLKMDRIRSDVKNKGKF